MTQIELMQYIEHIIGLNGGKKESEERERENELEC